MGLMFDDTLNCPECGHHYFRTEEQYVFHRSVKPRLYPSDKEKPLPHLAKIIIYRCAKCGFRLDY